MRSGHVIAGEWFVIGGIAWLSTGSAFGAVNSWTNTASGNWGDPYWSLGVLPSSGQNIVITNEGWKAVGINPATVQNHPETLSIDGLLISSPTNTFNTLLLNFAGVDHPLTTPALVVLSDSALVMLSSGLNVPSTNVEQFSINGTFTEAAGSLLQANYMSAGAQGPATLNLTNSLLSASTEFFGGLYPATIFQDGGTNTFTTFHLNNATYNLYNGQCSGSLVMGDSTASVFNQWNGVFNGSVAIAHGTYCLMGGLFSSGTLQIPAVTLSPVSGSFVQAGGTNEVDTLHLGDVGSSSQGIYVLSNGVVNAQMSIVGGGGKLDQQGGVHAVQGNLEVSGALIAAQTVIPAYYTLESGLLTSSTLYLSMAQFNQLGGSNLVSGDLNVMSGPKSGGYTLSAGWLASSNTLVSGVSKLIQNGGTHWIGNTLTVQCDLAAGYGYYLKGGELSVPNLVFRQGAGLIHTNGILSRNTGLTLDGGEWIEQSTGVEFGSLMLNASGNGDSRLYLPGAGSCVVRFADSSGLSWPTNATLTLCNWGGSLSGGGTEQVIFGGAESALTSAQVQAIRFRDPHGQPAGLYPARILSTGEVVPGLLLEISRGTTQLVLQWAGGDTLQTATNAAGPYADLSAGSSYTNALNDPQRFFRLRQ